MKFLSKKYKTTCNKPSCIDYKKKFPGESCFHEGIIERLNEATDIYYCEYCKRIISEDDELLTLNGKIVCPVCDMKIRLTEESIKSYELNSPLFSLGDDWYHCVYCKTDFYLTSEIENYWCKKCGKCFNDHCCKCERKIVKNIDDYIDVVYFLKCSDKVKIGYTSNLKNRIKALETAHFEKLEVIHVLKGSKKLEKQLHKKFKCDRIKNEWFQLSDGILEYIEKNKGKSLI